MPRQQTTQGLLVNNGDELPIQPAEGIGETFNLALFFE
jgi:hypothetical protein